MRKGRGNGRRRWKRWKGTKRRREEKRRRWKMERKRGWMGEEEVEEEVDG